MSFLKLENLAIAAFFAAGPLMFAGLIIKLALEPAVSVECITECIATKISRLRLNGAHGDVLSFLETMCVRELDEVPPSKPCGVSR